MNGREGGHHHRNLSADQNDRSWRAAGRGGGLVVHVVAVACPSIVRWGVDAIATCGGVRVVGVVIETVGIKLHGGVGVGGDALGGGEGRVVADEEPSLLALEGCAGDLCELGSGNELRDLCPCNGAVFLVGQCHLLPQQHVLL